MFPEDGDCFAGIGAALCSSDYAERPFDDILERLEKSVDSVGLCLLYTSCYPQRQTGGIVSCYIL